MATATAEEKFLNCENFFITATIAKEYTDSKAALYRASLPPKKKFIKA